MAVLTEEQEMLRNMAAEWARERMPMTAIRSLYEHTGGGRPEGAGFAADAYAEAAAMGWTGILVPEQFGGSDFGALSLGLILEELGRTLAPVPLLGTAMIAVTRAATGWERGTAASLAPPDCRRHAPCLARPRGRTAPCASCHRHHRHACCRRVDH